MAQLAKHPTWPQVMISRFLSSKLAWGELKPHFGLCDDSAEPVWDSLSLSLALVEFSLPLPLSLAHSCPLSLSLLKKKIHTYIKALKKREYFLLGHLDGSVGWVSNS